MFQWPGFDKAGLDFVSAGLMRTGYLGVNLYTLGNILFELFTEMGGGQRSNV